MTAVPSPSSHERFRNLDGYRVAREWARYEGTAQRELFLELRLRFLRRHRGPAGPTADLGSGPGRFTDTLGDPGATKLLLDLSPVALRQARERPSDGRRDPAPRHYLVGDAARPPLREGRFASVALLGNILGFAGEGWDRLLESAARLVAPGGTLVLEAVAGPGEHARYLQRLPRGAAVRALRAPPAWVDARVDGEGFVAMEPRKPGKDGEFQRLPPERLSERLAGWGLRTREVIAVAPVMGTEPERIEAVRRDAKAWAGLLSLEERFGVQPLRWERAAAFLLAADRTPPGARLDLPAPVRTSAGPPRTPRRIAIGGRRLGSSPPLGRRRAVSRRREP